MEPICEFCGASDKFRCRTLEQSIECKAVKKEVEYRKLLKYTKQDIDEARRAVINDVLVWIDEYESNVIETRDIYSFLKGM